MQQIISTLRLTLLFLLGLALIGWTSINSFSQKRHNNQATVAKKTIIIKTIDENGNVQTKIIEDESADIGQTHNPAFGKAFAIKKMTQKFGDRNKEKKVIILQHDEAIPDHLRQEIIEMGVSITEVEQKLKAANHSVRIYKAAGQQAIIEQDVYNDAEEQLERNSEIQSMKFDTEDIPEEAIQKLKELGIDLNDIGQSKSWKGCGDGYKETTTKTFLGVIAGHHDGEGVAITKVVENSAAQEAGIKNGDIILSINGDDVSSSHELVKMIKLYQPGDQVKIKLDRNGKTKKVKPTLRAKEVRKRTAKFETRNPEIKLHDGPRPDYAGPKADCEELCTTPMLGVLVTDNRYNGNGTEGARILKVFERTGAKTADLHYEDIITAFDNAAITSKEDLIAEILKRQPGDIVSLNFTREGSTKTVKAELTSKAATRRYANCDCSQPDFKKQLDKELIIIKQSDTPEYNPITEDAVLPTPPRITKPAIKRSLEVEAIALYPNPNDGVFTIDFALENATPIQLTIVNVAGKEIYRNEIADFNGNYNDTIDISRFAKGSYFLNIIQGDKVYTETFVFN